MRERERERERERNPGIKKRRENGSNHFGGEEVIERKVLEKRKGSLGKRLATTPTAVRRRKKQTRQKEGKRKLNE